MSLRHVSRVLLFASSLLAAGCGDDAPNAPNDDLDPDAPAFVVGTRVWDDTATTSYFQVLPSLEAGTVVDTKRALEVPGAAKLLSAFDLGWFAIGGGDTPTITRYTLGEDGQLEEGARITLQQYGVQDLWETIYFVSPTKAYYPDRAGSQLIVWNPTSMEVSGAVPIDASVREGFLSLYGYAPILRGDELLITVAWFDWTTTDSALAETGLVVIDTRTDTVKRVDVDTRCGGITTPVMLASGDVLLASSALAAGVHRVGRLATKPCALRVKQGESRIDPEYAFDLTTLSGGALVGEPVPALGESVFLRVHDSTLAGDAEPLQSWEVTGQSAWRWLRWDTTEATAAPVSSLPPSTADVLWFRVGERVFGSQTLPDYSQSTLIDLTSADEPFEALVAPGFLHGVSRVR